MADQYHISDDGTPGKCRAASPESCPKTKGGDSFHGTLEEANAESERRFEESYGATLTLSSASDKERWDRVAEELHLRGVDLYRRDLELGETDVEKTHSEVDGLKRKGLAELHGVPETAVVPVGNEFLVNEADGTRRIYGNKGPKHRLGYLGVLHPKLAAPAQFSSEHKVLYRGKEATPEQMQKWDTEWFGYGSVELKGFGKVEFTTDPKGNPVDREVWDHIDSSKLPRELFEDESLRKSIRNRGILKG